MLNSSTATSDEQLRSVADLIPHQEGIRGSRYRQSRRHVQLVLAALLCWTLVDRAAADSAGDYDLPGPGLAYGGIPYGSETGNVAAYYRRGGATYNYKPGVSGRFSGNNYDFFSRDFD